MARFIGRTSFGALHLSAHQPGMPCPGASAATFRYVLRGPSTVWSRLPPLPKSVICRSRCQKYRFPAYARLLLRALVMPGHPSRVLPLRVLLNHTSPIRVQPVPAPACSPRTTSPGFKRRQTVLRVWPGHQSTLGARSLPAPPFAALGSCRVGRPATDSNGDGHPPHGRQN